MEEKKKTSQERKNPPKVERKARFDLLLFFFCISVGENYGVFLLPFHISTKGRGSFVPWAQKYYFFVLRTKNTNHMFGFLLKNYKSIFKFKLIIFFYKHTFYPNFTFTTKN